ncbi:hypothetical protein L3X38_042713 [Prunus dulcis]|uniref:Uncharacterized protein n=1 Tax=Prunus dulcis TaxID=3755 RepID=A0AAD4YKK2_PRUDU|nr:hypothetical protein L3X38_042695 [Prunus dulcis]KAI5313537.1 hypothetical protein L3X38_042713 [Prunus dulcis]
MHEPLGSIACVLARSILTGPDPNFTLEFVSNPVRIQHLSVNPDMFTLEVHHGGYFVDGLCIGGIVQWVDGQDADEVSMLKLFELVQHIGYDD